MSEILEELDFKPRGDGHLATSYRTNFGPFEIEATPGVNLYLQRGYSLHGTVKLGLARSYWLLDPWLAGPSCLSRRMAPSRKELPGFGKYLPQSMWS